MKKILPTAFVIALGFAIFYPLELYLEGILAHYIESRILITAILLAIAFGPVFYFEEKIEKFIKKRIERSS